MLSWHRHLVAGQLCSMHMLTPIHDILQAQSFQLEEDLSSYGHYQRGGIVTQHKLPKTIAFRPLDAALSDPGEFLLTDFSKFERPGHLHIGFQALDAFQVGAFCCQINKLWTARPVAAMPEYCCEISNSLTAYHHPAQLSVISFAAGRTSYCSRQLAADTGKHRSSLL